RGRSGVLPAHLETAQRRHAEPAELDVDVRELTELGDLRAPIGEDFLALVGIRADAKRAADMVEHDLGFRERAGEVDQIPELAVKHPRLEREVERRQRRKALAPGAVEIKPFAGPRGEDPEARVGMPGGAVADAAETPARGDDVLLKDTLGSA